MFFLYETYYESLSNATEKPSQTNKIKYNLIFQVTFISNYFISKSFFVKIEKMIGVDTPFRNKIFEKV